jgi:hypothetical protein
MRRFHLKVFLDHGDHLGHTGEQGGPGFGFVAQGGAPLFEYVWALFRRRTLHGTIEVPALDYDTLYNYLSFVFGPRAGFI